MLDLNVVDETSRLRAVVLGTAVSNGPTPSIEDAYDPKSLEHILNGTYPTEKDMIQEMDTLESLFLKYEIDVYRPSIIEDYNQIFSRDIGFVIEDKFIKANVLPERSRELGALEHILDKINPNNIISAPEQVHFEGGDVMLWGDHIFIGTYKRPDYADFITARTNALGVDFIKELFPNKTISSFDLVKSKTNAKENALHLDCCFQPVGTDKAIIHKEGFYDPKEYAFLVELFGMDNLFHISKQEMYDMNSNVFSIDKNVVVSEKSFSRLNNWLAEQGFIVEAVPYGEIAKQEGLLRCTTLPLIRDK
ncbi:dimethylarginine dimethylaminohydrolase family protein [Myroides sp. LJL116]